MVALAHVRSSPPFVLLVDDDDDTSEMYSLYLHHAGLRVAQAHDARQAVAAAVADHPDVIVTDMGLPPEAGLDLCRQLKQEEATREIPIVTVTGRFEDIAGTTSLSAVGVEAVLLKPCEPARLLAEIRRVLEKSHNLRNRAMQARARAGDVQRRAHVAHEHNRALGALWQTRLDARSHEIAQRIRGEFREMPGLHLTLAQASRLWDVDRETCQRILDDLVSEKFLAVRTGRFFMAWHVGTNGTTRR